MANPTARNAKHYSGLNALAKYVPGATKKAFEKYGFAYGEIARHWADIVGEEVARHTSPERIAWPRKGETGDGFYNGGVLTIRVDGPRAVEIQHEATQILERLNQYYGYRALGSIKIVQGPIPQRQTSTYTPKPENARPQTGQSVDETTIRDIENDKLKNALLKLGRHIRK